MLNSPTTLGIAIVLVIVAIWLFLTVVRSQRDGEISGKLIWTDHGRKTKAFRNRQYRIFGKPDLMFRVRSGVKAVEYKHRNGPVFRSDIAQALAAALAARGEGYRVTEVLLKTRTQELTIDLGKSSDKDIYNKIKENAATVIQARSGKSVEAKPEYRKCRGCAYREPCR